MRILFNLMTKIEIPDADYFPKRGDVEEELVEFFKSEGMIAHSLEITNYAALADEQEDE